MFFVSKMGVYDHPGMPLCLFMGPIVGDSSMEIIHKF